MSEENTQEQISSNLSQQQGFSPTLSTTFQESEPNNQTKNISKNDTTTSSNTSAYSQQLIFPASDVKHFVGGFNSDVTEDHLRTHFSRFGTVADVKIMKDPVSGHSRGFGFVTMAEPSSKQRIMEEKEHMICGKKASVRPYSEAELKDSFTDGPILKKKIFVGGVNPALGHEVLENYFGKYGPLEDATIMRYPDGRSRGFGFVVFRDESACQQVLQQRNHFVTPRDKVEVKPCLSRGKSRTMMMGGGSMMSPEPYYHRYDYGMGGTFGPMHPYQQYSGYGGSPVGESVGGSGYYNHPSSMYGHYNRSSNMMYENGYGGGGSHMGWGGHHSGGGDYRDWWGPYDSYGSYYGSGGHSRGWHSGGGAAGGSTSATGSTTTPIGNYGPRSSSSSSGGIEGPSTGAPTSRPYSYMMTGGTTGTSPMSGATPTGHHPYGMLRRGAGGIPPTTTGGGGVNYSIPRGRGTGGY